MKADKKYEVHLGNNIKHLMKALGITQSQLADKLDMTVSQLCNLLQKADIDDAMLQKIVDAIGYGVSVSMIKNYNHQDTISYIINNYTQNVEEGGTGTLIPNQENDNSTNSTSTFEEGSQPTINHYVAEQAFESMREIAELKTEIMRLRMKYEPEAVEAEIKKKNDTADSIKYNRNL